MGSRISVVKVAKDYRRGDETVHVLHDLSLDIHEGEFVAIMGPSGSGKSTLLNLIAGLDKPTIGDVVVNGQRLGDLNEAGLTRWRSRNVGFVFQSCNLLQTFSALQNIEVPLLLTPLSNAQRRKNAQTALQLVGLHERAHHKPTQLSGGQQQRVAIARAIVADAPLLVCDEPTGNLDRASADDVLKLLSQLCTEFRKTIIMVTHDPKAASFANRTIVLDKGARVDIATEIAA